MCVFHLFLSFTFYISKIKYKIKNKKDWNKNMEMLTLIDLTAFLLIKL